MCDPRARWRACATPPRTAQIRRMLANASPMQEPNGMGKDNATDIAALMAAAWPAFEAAGETWVGPASAGIDFPYLNASFAAGLLDHAAGVSVHPYRAGPPESATGDLLALAALIAAYAPPRAMPCLSGEWGYTSPTGDLCKCALLFVARRGCAFFFFNHRRPALSEGDGLPS